MQHNDKKINLNTITNNSNKPKEINYNIPHVNNIDPVVKGELVLLVVHNSETVGVIDVNKEQHLSEVRRKMKEDEVRLPQKFTFLYKDTGAPITEKQEYRYKILECLITDSKTGMQCLLIQ